MGGTIPLMKKRHRHEHDANDEGLWEILLMKEPYCSDLGRL